MPPLTLDTPVQFLKGVGQHRADLLQRLGITTARDLLYHVPFRYLDATTVLPISHARTAPTGSDVTVVGRVVSTAVIPTRRRLRVFQCVLKDDSGLIECGWPGRPFLERSITKGTLLLATGPIRHFHGRQLQPREWIILGGEEEAAPAEGVVLPVYHATEGLTVRQLRGLLDAHVPPLLALVREELPERWRERAGVVPLPEALRLLHQPENIEAAERGRRRLAFEELVLLQLVLARARWLARQARAGIRFEVKKDLTTKLRESLPFELTGAQKRCLKEIVGDMTAPVRMHRLLQGDVGSGKTVVALFAMLLAAENGFQAALMAPTEMLAEQHARTLQRLLAPLGIVPELLIGRLAAGEKAEIRARLRTGMSPLAVGTHALIQEDVSFRRLGLAVIDEQHRFGVAQRALLAQKNEEGPDILLLSATPIPRTLALAVYGDLDVSKLDELPPGRGSVTTTIETARGRPRLYEFIRKQVTEGRQAYVVYPVIEESEKTDLKAASKMAKLLSEEVFTDLKVGLVHGRMAADERDKVMRKFRNNEINILVATTVIEVGIDVANATVMVIEHPERFGLAQLHQLRGRIGRGSATSWCVLLPGEGANKERLERFAETQDGFRIAELDLQERGHGELVGARQSGVVGLRYADLAKDADLLELSHDLARRTIAEDPSLEARVLRPVVTEIGRRFERGLELFRAIQG